MGIGKGLDRAVLIESKCRRLPQVYASSYTEQTGTLLLYYNASIPGSRVMLWVKELFSDYKQTAGLSDYGENGPAALPSEIFRNILAIRRERPTSAYACAAGAVAGVLGYRLYEQYGDQLKSLVLSACAPVIKAVTSGAEPTLEELMAQKERLEDLIAEKKQQNV